MVNQFRKSQSDPAELNSTHQHKAAQMELFLNAVALQNIATANCILHCLLEKTYFESARIDLQEYWLKEKNEHQHAHRQEYPRILELS
jgi:hypothetical protein